MEIRGYGHYRSASSHSTTVTLKAGDVYEAVVKEQVGEKEAIVQLRGVDIRFRFEGDVPPSGRVKVQVTGGDGDIVEGKVVTPPPASSFEKFETPELRQAAMIVTQKQLPLTRETVESLRTFLTEGKGTVEQKLETIQIAATKKLDMTIKQLQAVHEALHGKSFSESLHDIVQAIDKHFSFTPIVKQQSQTVSELRAQLQQERNMDRVLELAKQFAEENRHDEIAKAVREATILKERGHETFARSRIMQAVDVAETNEKIDHGQMERATTKEKQLKMVRQQIEREPIVAKALTIAKGSDVVRQTLGRALQEAEQLYRSGQPLSAKERLLEAFASVEEKDNVPTQLSPTTQKQMVDEAKRMVRNARSIEDAVRQLKETALPRIEANELHEAIERVEQLGEKAKTDLIQALRAVGAMRETLRPNAPIAKVNAQEAQLKQVVEVRKQVENAPTVKAVEPQVRELARTLPAEQAEKVVRALEQSKQQETMGRSVEARQQLSQTLRAVEEDTIAGVVRTAKEAVRANTPATAVETKEAQLKQVVEVRKQVESTPTVKAVEPQVRELARTLPAEQAEKVVRALEQSKQQEAMGRNVEARQQLSQTLRAVEEDTIADVVRTAKEAVRANTPATKVNAQEAQLKQVVEVRRQVENAPTVKAVEPQVRELARTLPAEQAEKVVRALEQSKQQETMGRSVEARQQLSQTLRAVEEDTIADVVRTAKEAVRANTPATAVETKEAQLKQVVEVRKQVENAPTVKAVEPQVRELARTLPAEQAEKVVRALSQAKLFETVGRGVEVRQPLVQALQSIEQQLEPEYMNRAKMIADRLEQQTMTLTEAVRQLQADAMLTKQPNMPQTLQQMAQMLDKQREQLFTAIATIENEQRATNDVRALIAQAIKTIQKEPNVKEALQMARAHLAQHMEPLLHDAFARADELAKNGREMAARQTVVQALQQIETTLPTNDASSPADAAYESLVALGLQSKDMIVQTVTKRMAEATKQFQQAKRDMMRNLDAIDHLITQYKQAARPQAKQLLETTIKQLDQTILKSDAMLFADMTMEKKLLQASSQLAEAKKLLDKGQMAEAQKIVKQVKSTLEQMQFKPSDVKVKHFVQAQSLKQQTPEQALLTQWNEIVQPEPSARHMLQTIHRLGFMHEADIANSLVFHGESEQSEETMKGLLMKLAQTGGEGSKQAEQALTHMTGQQLLNKNDQGSAMQTLFFTIPLLLQKEVKDVKVYVNARNDGKRVDWENCSLYFLLETKKIGDVGVLLSANERTLSVTFRNDREDFAERMRPLVETATKRLEEIGYRVGNVQFTTFAKHEEKSNEPKRATWTEKGYDFTI
ncbi:metal-dependent peptidase [Anoxybacillus kestanbolensis]|uniref:Metal-dependent peptidase n=1 Tax=Anoxybacillus kestanbolensis TaxID=227476 RepID=A0A1V3FPP6_9BACL|nr:metal-dependent peptidase [Anoxybacillus kestanbolensis]OOE03579.1 metal-dependent peptidase [Anoxybacillus kestanbolensis]